LAYEARFEEFGVIAPDGRRRRVRFSRAGTLAAGDQPEIYLFQVDDCAVKVGIAGEALRQLQQENRYLTREEKIDVAGLRLRQAIERGGELASKNLFIEVAELASLVRELGLLR
jgi:hypothetical protein